VLIKKENLAIRLANVNDAEVLAKWWNDGKVMAHAGFPNGLGITVDEVIESIEKNATVGGRLIIEIDGLPAGETNFRDKGNGIAEIGIKICETKEQDKGYGKILLSMLINHLFKELGFAKVILDTNVKNLRAQSTYKKLGFKELRVNENSWQCQNGEWQSSIDYELVEANFINFAS